ncbi:MAG: tetratricopeptide repeat protein [Pyrinomonadaceae bacterium]
MTKRKFYSLITIVSAAFLFISCASHAETEEPSPQVSAEQIAQGLAKADALFAKREDVLKLRDAVETLEKVRDADNRNFEVEWKYSKYNYFLSKQTASEEEAEKILKEGVTAGIIASRIEPDKPDGHFWYGANLGEQAKRSPVTVGLNSVDDIRETMNKVIAIDPKYQGASAYDALAQIELSTGIIGGKPEKAVEYLEKALAIGADNTYIHLHLAEAYLAVGNKTEAKKQLDYLLQMKPAPGYEVEYKETTEAAKKILERRF